MSQKSKKVLAEKVALVTGSTYGIGLAIARRLAQDGAHVVLSSRKQTNVNKAVSQLKEEGLSVSGITCHVGSREDREKLVKMALECYGKIDILVCNAAVNPFVGPILETTEKIWEKVFHVNVISTFQMIKLVAPHMDKQGGGSIVIISSFIGYIPLPHFGPYSVSKTSLFALTVVLAHALRSMNIRVNGLAVGLINTGFSKVIRNTPQVAEQMTHFGILRSGEPEECAGIVSFLCSSDASYINGENIAVTGGMYGKL
ncbi:dehydrogenase/reductase SDR family member 4-like [Rhinophrynus dorsalis]